MPPEGRHLAWRCNVEVDEKVREFRRDGLRFHLERKVFKLLVYLIRHRDRVVSKQELFDAIWTGTVVGEAALTRCVYLARKALETADLDQGGPWSGLPVRGYGGGRQCFVGLDAHDWGGCGASSRWRRAWGEATYFERGEFVDRPWRGGFCLRGASAGTAVARGAFGACRRGARWRVPGSRRSRDWQESNPARACGWRVRARGLGSPRGKLGRPGSACVLALASGSPEVGAGDGRGGGGGWVLGAASAELVQVAAVLAVDESEGGAPAGNRLLFFERIAEVLDRVARVQPIAVLLDDLHHADLPSLHLFAFLARALASSRVLLLGAHRAGDLCAGRGAFGCARSRSDW